MRSENAIRCAKVTFSSILFQSASHWPNLRAAISPDKSLEVGGVEPGTLGEEPTPQPVDHRYCPQHVVIDKSRLCKKVSRWDLLCEVGYLQKLISYLITLWRRSPEAELVFKHELPQFESRQTGFLNSERRQVPARLPTLLHSLPLSNIVGFLRRQQQLSCPAHFPQPFVLPIEPFLREKRRRRRSEMFNRKLSAKKLIFNATNCQETPLKISI